MRILILSHISDLVGGAEMSMINLFDYWAKNYDIEPIFIMRKPAGTLASALNKRKWKYYELDYSFWSDGAAITKPEDIFNNAVKNSKAVREIEKIIENENPEIVMTNTIVSPWAAIAAYYRNIPHLWFVREYGDLDHGRIFEIGREKTFEDIDTLSSLVVANSTTLASHIKQYIDNNKVTALYTPFDIDDIEKRAKQVVVNPFKSNKSLKLVITGNLAPSKGQIEAVQAVGILHRKGFDVELCVIGGKASKEFMEELTQLIETNHLQNKVHLLGFQKNPMAYVALADVGIMASRMEAFGRVTYEYITIGKPVVGSDSGATPEMVKAGRNGYLYKPGDPNSLAEALLHYAKDRDLLKKHGQASEELSKQMIKSEFGASALYERVSALLESKQAPTYAKPLNYTHRFFEYIDAAENYIKEATNLSAKSMLVGKVKVKAKNRLRHAKQIARRVLKK